MSLDDAKKYIHLLHTDDALRKKVSSTDEDHVKAAKDKGLTVTAPELRTALNEHWVAHPNSHALSETPGF